MLSKAKVLVVPAMLIAGPAYAAEGGGGSSPFAGAIYQSIAALICFILLAVLLAKFAWGPIITGLQKREEKIKGDLESAEQARTDAEAALAEYKAKITEAQKEAQKVVDEARKSAEQVAAKVKADAETEIGKMRERSQAEIAAAKDQAISEMQAHMAELSTQIAGRILKREINADDQQQLVNESLSELTQSGV